MADKEYYNSGEFWPQPPDERTTLDLEPRSSSNRAEPDKKASRRKRKKLTDSLGSLVIGAVAVIMVTISSPLFDEKELDGGLGGPIDGEICEICGEIDCNYWGENYLGNFCEGLTVRLNSPDATPVADDLYQMPYYANGDGFTEEQSHCIYTQDSKRVLLSIKSDEFPSGYHTSSWHLGLTNTNSARPATEDAFVGTLINVQHGFGSMLTSDEKTLYVQLLYSPSGQMPEIGFGTDIGIHPEYLYTYTGLVPGFDNVWLRASSDIDQNICDQVWDYVKVETVNGDNVRYPLGTTMEFLETENVRRIWGDAFFQSVREYPYLVNDLGQRIEAFFDSDFVRKSYNIWSLHAEAQLVLAQNSWIDIMNEWQRLNDQAPGKGHQVLFRHNQMENFYYNGIDYMVHLVWCETEQGKYDAALILVPAQETTLAVVFRGFSITEEDMNLVLMDSFLNASEERTAPILMLLDQLSIRSGDHDAETPNPTEPVICTVCNEKNCPYYFDHYVPYAEGLHLLVGKENYSISGSFDPMVITKDHLMHEEQGHSTPCLYTGDSIRLFLSVDPRALPFSYIGYSASSFWSGNSGACPSSEACAVTWNMSYMGMSVAGKGGVEDEEDMIGGSLMIQLLYSPDGIMPDVDFGLEHLPSGQFVYTEPVQGVQNVWLRVHNNISEEMGRDCAKVCKIRVISGDNLTYQLGETLTFQESENVGRLWDDYSALESETTVFVSYNHVPATFHGNFHTSQYRFMSFGKEMEMSLFITPFPDIVKQWMDLNAQAPEKGHSVHFPVKQLQNHTVNGVEYLVYAAWYLGDPFYQTTVFLVPVQEQNIVISASLNHSESPDLYDTYEAILENAIRDSSHITALVAQIKQK